MDLLHRRLNLSPLVNHWNSLDKEQQARLVHSLNHIDRSKWREQIRVLGAAPLVEPIEPLPAEWITKNIPIHCRERGIFCTQQGKTGAIVLAGGEGSRLRYTGPKGCYPILPNTSLFGLLAKRVLLASQKAQRALPLAIMTSPCNHEASVAHFREHHFFGLEESQLFFFSQSTLPLLDEEGQPFLSDPSTLAEGPDGNGRVFHHFLCSPVGQSWIQQGIEYIQILPIDNPLGNPYDEEWIGFHAENSLEISLRSILPKTPDEKLGRLGFCQKKPCVVEYTELPHTLAKNSLGHTGLFCFSLSFLQKHQKALDRIPLHKAWKKTLSFGQEKWAWKFETFLFDLLPLCSRFQTLLSDRNACFAPLKNAQGEDSPESVRALLQNQDGVIDSLQR